MHPNEDNRAIFEDVWHILCFTGYMQEFIFHLNVRVSLERKTFRLSLTLIWFTIQYTLASLPEFSYFPVLEKCFVVNEHESF